MFPINVVEKETGFSKYLLRMWERRYSFPRPARDDKGDRIYTHADLEKLKVVKTLIEEGYRPSKIMDQDLEALKKLAENFSKKEAVETRGRPLIIVTSEQLLLGVKKKLENQGVAEIVQILNSTDLDRLGV